MSSPGYCPACGILVMPLSRACVACDAKLIGKRVRAKAADIYDPLFDLRSLSDGQRREFEEQRLTSVFSLDAVVLLHLATIGLFSLIYFGLMHSKLPLVKHDDFRAKRAIRRSFIPFYNLYWVFRFWLRLVDRINLQIRLRGLYPAISRRFMLATVILSLIPGVNLSSVVMYPICIARIQGACNRIVSDRLGQYETPLKRL